MAPYKYPRVIRLTDAPVPGPCRIPPARGSACYRPLTPEDPERAFEHGQRELTSEQC
ncbi:hypothetical protein Snoj_25410 [Streptomyces nojiriensis]|uniref:Uncharacterized protein n=1 Tax=Streptomyces nojiriensis TaxID=66374 RepID=A0ABQ3SKE5_9ACTN|nr:hypothetical protein GCM10010205_68990 [Streptomyces nojiriensis]GHI68623.1 hypothetical protein Snoj_25410 [Streptomyces nojiriensis]